MSSPPIIHLCNTFFETELESQELRPLSFWMASHPIVRKLETLPLLFASSEDLILVSELPKNPAPRLCLLKEAPRGAYLESWGPSLTLKDWAKTKNISYEMPDWDLIKEIHSKVFSFNSSPKLAQAELLQNEKEALLWIEKTKGPKVLKTPFGTAGRGHFHISGRGDLASFLKREFKKNLPLIGEPWVERVLDFSTQWKDSCLLGATIFRNTPLGSYRETLAGPKSKIFGAYEWALEKHLEVAEPIVKKIGTLGFFGHIGIDSFVYLDGGKERVQPVVEINARKTMSWVALQIQQQKYPSQTLLFSFSPKNGFSFSKVDFS